MQKSIGPKLLLSAVLLVTFAGELMAMTKGEAKALAFKTWGYGGRAVDIAVPTQKIVNVSTTDPVTGQITTVPTITTIWKTIYCVGSQAIDVREAIDPFGRLPNPNLGKLYTTLAGWPDVRIGACSSSWVAAFKAAGVPIP